MIPDTGPRGKESKSFREVVKMGRIVLKVNFICLNLLEVWIAMGNTGILWCGATVGLQLGRG